MRSRHHYYPVNERGTDYAVGDIHGAFPYLQEKLEEIEFNPAVDRLFATGDLVDKGLHSRQAYVWLETHKAWFKSAEGNHDAHVGNFGKPTTSQWLERQGNWFKHLKPAFQQQMQQVFAELPICITVDTPGGHVGIVHAGTPYDTWYQTLSVVDTSARRSDLNPLLYSRDMFERRNEGLFIRDLKALVVGHCPVPTAEQFGNVWFIDTNAYTTGKFTLLNLHTLELI